MLRTKGSCILIPAGLCWLLLALLAAPAAGQVEQARLTGTVRDSSGAVIPRARISMVHQETNVEHAAQTNELGSYLSVPLRVGAYRVTASADGFKRAARGNVMLRIQETVLVDFTLEVGALTESVEVTAAPPLIGDHRRQPGPGHRQQEGG